MMKTIILALLTTITASHLLCSEGFDMDAIDALIIQKDNSLETNPLMADISGEIPDEDKVIKFNLLLQELGNPALGRQWTYPSRENWPLVDWDRVDQLENFDEDQAVIPNQFGVIAQSDEEYANLFTSGRLIRNLGHDMESWFELWILDLAKSGNTNMKILALQFIAGVGEDMGRNRTDEDAALVIRWTDWQEAYNQSDALGKALVVACVHDLALKLDHFDTASSIHQAIFSGENDELKALAIRFGGPRLGEQVMDSWQAIASEHDNAKLKSLATQAIALQEDP